jgi:hypothetical protein
LPTRIKDRPPPLPKWVRVSTLHLWVGISAQTITKISGEEAGCPRRKGTTGEWEYRWPEWNVWWHQRTLAKTEARVQRAKGGSDGGGSALDQERVRKWRAERELAELEVQRKLGSVMETEEHVRLVRDVVAKLRAGLLAFPSRLAPRVVGMTDVVKVEDRATVLVHDLMETLGARNGTRG